MTIDSDGVLYRSYAGMCSNYSPNRNKPTRVKAHDVEGLLIHECLNCKPTAEGRRIDHACGSIEFCGGYAAKTNGRGIH